jgi:hypothetical protein
VTAQRPCMWPQKRGLAGARPEGSSRALVRSLRRPLSTALWAPSRRALDSVPQGSDDSPRGGPYSDGPTKKAPRTAVLSRLDFRNGPETAVLGSTAPRSLGSPLGPYGVAPCGRPRRVILRRALETVLLDKVPLCGPSRRAGETSPSRWAFGGGPLKTATRPVLSRKARDGGL